ncbi:Ff.00g112060.m01.CDS01 [Fusarium sp. VM40]|nr:Ff.00g112060.m01.CDS01 [Fusarium sp. VM40]
MKDWQERAIREGRTPLPDYLGDKPSLATVGDLPAHPKSVQTGISFSHRSSSATVSTPAPQSLNQSYRFWSESDLRRLIEMRNSGMEWNAIAVEFPDRTLESIKQTFHKRRHAVEKRMAEERADTSS